MAKKRLSEERATGKLCVFFNSATWVSRKHKKYKTKGGSEFQLTYEYPKNRYTHVKCINRGVHGTLRNPGDAHGMGLANTYVKNIKAQGFKTPRNSKTSAKCIKLGGGR